MLDQVVVIGFVLMVTMVLDMLLHLITNAPEPVLVHVLVHLLLLFPELELPRLKSSQVKVQVQEEHILEVGRVAQLVVAQ